MTIKVENRRNPALYQIYSAVDKITEINDGEGTIRRQLHIGEETATYPVSEWKFYEKRFIEI